MSVPDKDWSIVKPVPLTKERVRLICLEETIKQLPRLQYRMNEITGKIDNPPNPALIEYAIRRYDDEYYILSEEYDHAIRAKNEFAERTNRQWADYVHNQATLEFYSKLK
jgi:hypothetical protein